MKDLCRSLELILNRLKILAEDTEAHPQIKFGRRIGILNALMSLRSSQKTARLSKHQIAKLQEKYLEIDYAKRMTLKDQYPEIVSLIEEHIYPKI